MKINLLLGTALMLGIALPAAAQMPPPPSDGMPGPGGPGPRGPGGPHGRMFASMSDAGRKIMMESMRGADPRADHSATQAARDRMLAILDADRLDVAALRQAMDAEREAADASRIKHQAAMLAGFQKLTLADRRAFVADARAMRARMEGEIGKWQGRHGGREGGMRPPPPPM